MSRERYLAWIWKEETKNKTPFISEIVSFFVSTRFSYKHSFFVSLFLSFVKRVWDESKISFLFSLSYVSFSWIGWKMEKPIDVFFFHDWFSSFCLPPFLLSRFFSGFGKIGILLQRRYYIIGKVGDERSG